jgi:predicted transposase/invertase (TIGR01784 family)
MKKLTDRLSILKMSNDELEAYRNHMSESLKERDYIISAEEKGRIEGRIEGEEKGRIEEKIELAKKMFAKNKSIDEIHDLTELSIEELLKLKP